MPIATPLNLCRFAAVLLALAAASPICQASSMPTDAAQISAAVESLFEAMRRSDADAIRAAFAPEAVLERVTADGQRRPTRIADFAAAVSAYEQGAVDEKVFATVIQQFEQLATMWAPFKLYVDGELKACGVNQITLARLDGAWKIIHLVDRHHDGDCQAFIDRISDSDEPGVEQ